MMNKMASSISARAQISIDPKAKGVKRIRAMRRRVITELNIDQSSRLKAQSKTNLLNAQSSKLKVKLFTEIRVLKP